MIQDPNLKLVKVGGSHLVDVLVFDVELLAAWMIILYTRLIVETQHIIIKEDPAIVVGWL